ncbi:hypothetical protein GCM10022393_06860 [Aquimarina addita]|uniref:Tetratricopeptide repeat protein n=1 Tax=Aquimarina addita TaxID=870485 RepID=A0ABP7XBE3_9FLAO
MIKYWLYIRIGLVFLAGSTITVAQEIEPTMDINVDDLGNVSDEFQENFFEALKQKAITNYEKAIDALDKCIALDAKPLYLYSELGKNYLELKQYDQAVVNFTKVLDDKPNDRYLLELLYEVYFKQRKYKEAAEVIEKLVVFDITYKEQLANLYYLENRYDEALVIVDNLIDELGSDQYRMQLRKKITQKISNPDSQIARLEKKIKENPKEEQNYLNLIYLYSQDNQEAKAYKIAKELLDKKPKSKLVHLALYKFYLDDKKTDDAIKSMKIALSSKELEAEPKYKVINDFLSFVDQNPSYEGELMEVVKQFSDTSENSKIFTEIGNYFSKKNKKELALDFYERGIKDNVTNFNVLRKMLLLQLDLKRYEKAKEGSELAIEIYPSQPILYLIHGVSLINLNSPDDAIDILSLGMDYVIDDVKMESDFYDQIGEAYLKKGDVVKATEYKEKSTQLKEKS